MAFKRKWKIDVIFKNRENLIYVTRNYRNICNNENLMKHYGYTNHVVEKKEIENARMIYK